MKVEQINLKYDFRPTEEFMIYDVKFPPFSISKPQAQANSLTTIKAENIPLGFQGIKEIQRIMKSNYSENLFLGEHNGESSTFLAIGEDFKNHSGIDSRSDYSNLGRDSSACIPKEEIWAYHTRIAGEISDIVEAPTEHPVLHNIARLLHHKIPGSPQKHRITFHSDKHTSISSPSSLSILTTQLYCPPIPLFIVTSNHIHKFITPRPKDLLFHFILNTLSPMQSSNSHIQENQINVQRYYDDASLNRNPGDSIMHFVQQYGPIQVCDMLLQIICATSQTYYINQHYHALSQAEDKRKTNAFGDYLQNQQQIVQRQKEEILIQIQIQDHFQVVSSLFFGVIVV